MKAGGIQRPKQGLVPLLITYHVTDARTVSRRRSPERASQTSSTVCSSRRVRGVLGQRRCSVEPVERRRLLLDDWEAKSGRGHRVIHSWTA